MKCPNVLLFNIQRLTHHFIKLEPIQLQTRYKLPETCPGLVKSLYVRNDRTNCRRWALRLKMGALHGK
jgi:hypothetical protein